jgi:hypothetical protein
MFEKSRFAMSFGKRLQVIKAGSYNLVRIWTATFLL